jgi:hypothetical protein
MSIEVYVGTRPTISRRAWLVSILLLTVSVALAATMTWRRSDDPLAARIRPVGWSISFRPPRRFQESEFGATVLGSVFRFRGWSTTGAAALLAVHRLDRWPVADPLAACELVLSAYIVPRLPDSMTTRFTRFDTKFGPFDAVEIHDPLLGVIVRAAVFEDGEVYAISLGVDGPMIEDRSYRAFDLACRSIIHHEH